MILRILLACLALVIGCASDTLAQFTPVVAKIKISHYRTQSDGTEEITKVRKGVYYRSSAGDEMKTDYSVNEQGERREPGKSYFREASTRRIYLLDHNSSDAVVVQKLTSPLIPHTPSASDNSNNQDVINGLRCISVPLEHADGNTIGKVWIALDIENLVVKRETKFPNRRFLWELYDISFTEPDPSQFSIPPHYQVDESNCRGCD